MKQKNYSIETALLFAETLTKKESKTIKGGDFVTDLLTNIFHRQANVSNEQWNLFVANITDLASTTIGHDVLNQLLVANTEIKVTGDVPPGGGGADYAWTSTNKKIEIGGYDVTMSSVWSFDKTTHEIYHAYQDIVKHTLNTIAHDARAEIDAQLFARMAEVEYDTDHNFSLDNNNSHVHAGQDFYSSPNQTTPEQIAYKNAWDDIMKNHNFTLANYNTLVNNFVGGTSYTGGINTATQASSLNDTEIDDLFNTDFNGYNLINTYPNNGSLYNNFNPNNFSLYDNVNHYYISSSTYWNPSGNNNLEQNLESFLNSCLANGVTVKYNDVIICDASSSSGGGSNGPNAGNTPSLQYYWGNATAANFFNTFGLFIYNTSSGTSSNGTGTTGGSSAPRSWHWGGAMGPVWDDNSQPLSPEEKNAMGIIYNAPE